MLCPLVICCRSNLYKTINKPCILYSSRKLRERDASKFHIQLCFSILGVLLVLLIGVDRTEVFGVCVTASALLHYFTLASVMWMGAEALLMFQKLVIVFTQITTKFIVSVSIVCWSKFHPK